MVYITFNLILTILSTLFVILGRKNPLTCRLWWRSNQRITCPISIWRLLLLYTLILWRLIKLILSIHFQLLVIHLQLLLTWHTSRCNCTWNSRLFKILLLLLLLSFCLLLNILLFQSLLIGLIFNLQLLLLLILVLLIDVNFLVYLLILLLLSSD